MTDIAINIESLKKTFTTKKDGAGSQKLFKKKEKYVRNVLDGINLKIEKGDVFGIIGRNGSGKSTLLKIISGIMKPDSGNIQVNGKIASILELGMGFHPDMTGRENIYLKGSMYGFSKNDLDKKIDKIISYAELGDYIDLPLRVYSSGMGGRLAFAIMVNVDADILIVDEVLSTGDAAFSMKASAHFKNMKRRGKTIIYVSHSIGTVEEMCDKVAWLENGKIKEVGQPKIVCGRYLSDMTETFEVVEETAKAGVVKSQHTLGTMYRDGYKVKRDVNIAKNWFSIAADAGYAPARVALADILVSENDHNNEEKIIDLYSAAAEQGSREARNKLSRVLTANKSSTEELKQLFAQLLSNKNPRLYLDYGDLLLKTSWSNEDRLEAMKYFKIAAEYQIADAEYQIAVMYRDGNGPVKNYHEYVLWLKRAAKHGHVYSQLLLGNLFNDGIRVERDVQESFKWYLLAAESGNPDAMYHVAKMYKEGIGIVRNELLSKKWFSAQTDSILSKHIKTVANSYSQGRDGLFDCGVSKKLNERLAITGDSEAEFNLGKMNLYGLDRNRLRHTLVSFESPAKNKHIGSLNALLNLYLAGFVEKNIMTNALQTMEEVAAEGNMWAAHHLGNIFSNNKFLNYDRKKSIKYHEMAISRGNFWSAYRLGEMYRYGKSETRDIDLALKWHSLASKNGIPDSSAAILEMYEASLANVNHLEQSLSDLENMALLGNITAARLLGKFYRTGESNNFNVEKSIAWLSLASCLGDSHSMIQLGIIYKDYMENEIEAEKWFKMSAENGDPEGFSKLIDMMGPDEDSSNRLNELMNGLESLASGGNRLATEIMHRTNDKNKST